MAKQNLLLESEKGQEQNDAQNTLIQVPQRDKEIFSMMEHEDLTNEDMRLVADLLGLEVAYMLIKELGGIHLNVPKRGLCKLHEKYIQENFNGDNAKQLALKCRVSVSFVYTSLKKMEANNG